MILWEPGVGTSKSPVKTGSQKPDGLRIESPGHVPHHALNQSRTPEAIATFRLLGFATLDGDSPATANSGRP